MNNKVPKVSIVIPVFNGANYLTSAIESALEQTYEDKEIIVVDDGSVDDDATKEIAKSYGDKIRYYLKENGGTSSALNFGIKNMNGEYFSWLSHDDVYYPKKIEMQINSLINNVNPYSISGCSYEFINEESKTVVSNIKMSKYNNSTYLKILSSSINGCSLLIPLICFEKFGMFDENNKTVHDTELWLRFAKCGIPFSFLPNILVQSRLHTKQQTHYLGSIHEEELNEFFLWAIDYLGEDCLVIKKELIKIILRKGAFKAYAKLILNFRDKKLIPFFVYHIYLKILVIIK